MPAFEKRHLTKKSENVSDWYHDVVVQAGLADYSVVKGCMIIKPYGYAIWERIQATLDGWFKEAGVQNAYFPIFIPMSLLEKEKGHLEGFSPELAVVTHGGGEKLAEPLAVRPTSETIMYQTFKDWVQSYRDLPLLINQWANVVRWEKRTYPFLRTTEFLWQEGHTVHQTEDEAVAMQTRALWWYRKFYEDYCAISPYIGLKSQSETFAGAKTTYSIELVMPDGRALQAATSHNLSDNFAKVFEILFLDESGERKHPFQTSWGLSTRSIGGLILSHGDDSGLVLPPKIAPHQVVILAIGGKDAETQRKVGKQARDVAERLKQSGIRAVVDDDAHHALGYRINEWELRGVPLRLEIGAKELETGSVAFARRDTFLKGIIAESDVVAGTDNLLDDIQRSLLERSVVMKQHLTREVATYDEFKTALADGRRFFRALWCEDPACEAKVKEETKATTRVLELNLADANFSGNCFACGAPATRKWLFAQSY
ncbi:MAG: proline--tRNA ligase [Patescibacteria group bacterium]